ncbi:hypothetical protein K461DRAFT_26406 [Myriangium duriaei CBS 260.36]|uniref:Uncharacterized protein n=1 Tax=Myriangium duriaei CBS 260.36 TaxID=1168546 RepID=A0A9P4JAG1_9PEZI|nr:hypothetical protein K461DRAFT_26406 [Myriangium duriaei CBS 260.36]
MSVNKPSSSTLHSALCALHFPLANIISWTKSSESAAHVALAQPPTPNFPIASLLRLYCGNKSQTGLTRVHGPGVFLPRVLCRSPSVALSEFWFWARWPHPNPNPLEPDASRSYSHTHTHTHTCCSHTCSPSIFDLSRLPLFPYSSIDYSCTLAFQHSASPFFCISPLFTTRQPNYPLSTLSVRLHRVLFTDFLTVAPRTPFSHTLRRRCSSKLFSPIHSTAPLSNTPGGGRADWALWKDTPAAFSLPLVSSVE